MVRGRWLSTSLNVVVTGIIHESVVARRKLRIAVGFAKIFQILAVVFGTEIDLHTHPGSSHVKVDIYSSSSIEHITTLDQPNRSCIG
jgi:hypothetical protein